MNEDTWVEVLQKAKGTDSQKRYGGDEWLN